MRTSYVDAFLSSHEAPDWYSDTETPVSAERQPRCSIETDVTQLRDVATEVLNEFEDEDCGAIDFGPGIVVEVL